MKLAANRTPVIGLWLAVIVVAACSTSSTSTTANRDASPSAVGVASTTPAPITTVVPEASAPTARPSGLPTAKVTAGTTAATVVESLRVRSQPRVSLDSHKLEPLLPRGTNLYVLDGPEAASGYAWYEVAPLTSRTLPSGWVASADRDGTPWIETRAFDCPMVPTDFTALAGLPAGVGLACFPRVPITVQARLLDCNCDVDGSWYTPSWFFLGSGSPQLLFEPSATNPAISWNTDDWFALNLDPNGQNPDVLPVGEVVEVTGMFDHPAAASCTRTDMDGEPVASQGCRLEFAVTKLVSRS